MAKKTTSKKTAALAQAARLRSKQSFDRTRANVFATASTFQEYEGDLLALFAIDPAALAAIDEAAESLFDLVDAARFDARMGKPGTPLADDERAVFERAAAAVYAAIGADAFGGDATDADAFVDVIRDRMDHDAAGLSEAQLARFRALTVEEKRRVILTAM